jgi:hypothetical protein
LNDLTKLRHLLLEARKVDEDNTQKRTSAS